MTNQYSISGTASGSATAYALVPRYEYIVVENTGTTGDLYFTTNGQAATALGAADYCYGLVPGESKVVANMEPLWTQAALVIGNTSPTGVNTNQSQYGTSLYGGTASPGTSVSIISAGTPTFTITGAG